MMEKLNEIISKYKKEKGALVPLLQDISEEYRYLPEEALKKAAKELKLPLSHLYSLATFYKSFRLQPRGEHVILICMGTACHVRGAQRLLEKIERDLGIKAGETTKDLKFTLETVNCLGACALGPLVVIDGQYHGNMNATKLEKILKRYRK